MNISDKEHRILTRLDSFIGLDEEYSGRGMLGETTTAVMCSCDNILKEEMASLLEEYEGTHDMKSLVALNSKLARGRVDHLGLSMIIY